MGEYTVQIREILQSMTERSDIILSSGMDGLINETYSRFFDFDFPFYTDSADAKTEFEKYFLRKFFLHEIGQETFGVFKVLLEGRLYDIMPKVKRLHETNLKINGLNTYSETRSHTTEDTGEQSNSTQRNEQGFTDTVSEGSSESKDRTFVNETPQGELSDIDSGKYLSNYTSNPTETSNRDSGTSSTNSEQSVTGNDTIHNIQTHTESVTRSENMIENAKKLLEIETNMNKFICDMCADLFMMIF